MPLSIPHDSWSIIWAWLVDRYGPIEDTRWIPTSAACAFGRIIQESDLLDFPPGLAGGVKAWKALADFFQSGGFQIKITPERIILDKNPVLEGPSLPESKWKYASEVRSADRAKEDRRSGLRGTPNDLDKLLSLPAWRGATPDGSPTPEDIAAITHDVTRAERILREAPFHLRPAREVKLAEEKARLKRAMDPRAQRVLHPSGAVLIWLPIS